MFIVITLSWNAITSGVELSMRSFFVIIGFCTKCGGNHVTGFSRQACMNFYLFISVRTFYNKHFASL